jgi:hypothetical protein
MKNLTPFRLVALALAGAALAIVTFPALGDRSGDRGHRGHLINAHGGTTFALTPVEFDASGNPTKFSHTVNGVVRVSLLGNCAFQADIPAVPHRDGTFSLAGTFRITSADGETSLDAEVEGVATPDPANPLFANVHYDVKFTSGTGRMKDVRGGRAEMDVAAMFTSQAGGTATWLLLGHATTRNRGHGD